MMLDSLPLANRVAKKHILYRENTFYTGITQSMRPALEILDTLGLGNCVPAHPVRA